MTETTTHLHFGNEKVVVLEADLGKQKKGVARLTTEFATENVRNVELGRNLHTSGKDLKKAQATAQEASKSVYAIQGAMSNMKRQMDDDLWTAVETVRLRVD